MSKRGNKVDKEVNKTTTKVVQSDKTEISVKRGRTRSNSNHRETVANNKAKVAKSVDSPKSKVRKVMKNNKGKEAMSAQKQKKKPSAVRQIDFTQEVVRPGPSDETKRGSSKNNNASPVPKRSVIQTSEGMTDEEEDVYLRDGLKILVDTGEFGDSDEELGDESVAELSDYGEEIEIGQSTVETNRQQSSSPDTMDDAEYEKLLNDPKFEKVFDKLLSRRLSIVTEQAKPGRAVTGKISDANNGKLAKIVDKNNKAQAPDVMKSPSDSTLYTPALKKVAVNQSVIEKISDFVQSIRAETSREDTTRRPIGLRPGVDEPEGLEQARIKAKDTIAQAERFKAKVNDPKGEMVDGASENFNNLSVSDDDFFHLSCHMETALRQKIEAGEYVDLEKLLPRDRTKRLTNGETRFEWVNRDSGTFLVPTSERELKINSVRCWDQAFRIYATIYCGANPTRSQEIWQYVSVINTAAASYMWDNVASYDFTFRHLMAFNPKRSWAKTYNQMWNLCMKDPLPKTNNQRNYSFSNFNTGSKSNAAATNAIQGTSAGHGSHSTDNNAKKGKKLVYCWNFNKGVPCKYGAKCRFRECCSYCDSPEHAVLSCPKLMDNK